MLKDIVAQNVTTPNLPQKGIWNGKPGNSDFIINDDAVVVYEKNGYHKYSGVELKQWMYENYGVSQVTYNHCEPDFLPFADKYVGQIYIEKMPTERTGKGGTFDLAEQEFAKRRNLTVAEVKAYMLQNELTWHECADTHTILAVPTRIHKAFSHLGGVSVQKSIESIRKTLSRRYDGGRLCSTRNTPFKKAYIVSGFDKSVREVRNEYKKMKRELFPK